MIDFYQKTLNTLSGSGLALGGVSLSPRGSWTISLVDGSEILLGQRDIDEHLQRFLDVFPRLAAGRGTNTFTRADLRYANGFAIRWPPVAAPDAPPPADKPAVPGKPPQAEAAGRFVIPGLPHSTLLPWSRA